MMKTVSAWLALALLWAGLLAACDKRVEPLPVDLSQRVPVNELPAAGRDRSVLRVGLGSMMTAKEGYGYYRPLIDYLEQRLGRPIRVIDREDYAGLSKLLEQGAIDVAFVCSGPYVAGHERFGLELLVVPKTAQGETVYYSNLIVPKDSPALSLDDLRGRRFAFVDPQSNTGRLIPEYLLAQVGETSERFFAETLYTYAHDKSIHLVSESIVDGAAVDSLIYDYLAAHDPEMVANTRVLMRSAPYGIPPLVVRKGLPPDLQERLRRLLLTMHENQAGQKVLAAMLIERYVEPQDRDYDSIRQMRAALQPQACR